jgi:hypothetical protein
LWRRVHLGNSGLDLRLALEHPVGLSQHLRFRHHLGGQDRRLALLGLAERMNSRFTISDCGSMISTAWDEAKITGYGCAYEQATHPMPEIIGRLDDA